MAIPEQIRKLIGQVQVTAGILRSYEKGDLFQGVIDELRDKIESKNHPQMQELRNLHSELQAYFSTSAPKGRQEENNGTISIVCHENNRAAYLTLIPPRSDGSDVSLNKVLFHARDMGITFGIDLEMVKKAVDSCVLRKDIILMVKIAAAQLPKKGKSSCYELSVNGLDIDALTVEPTKVKDMIHRLSRVKNGAIIADYVPAIQGVYGVNIKGEDIPPEKGDTIEYSFSDNIKLLESKALQALSEGVVIRKSNRIEIQDVFYMSHSMNEQNRRLFFDGVVIVEGDVKGPLEIIAREIVITGKLERANLHAKGDIFIFGGIFGKRESTISAGGRLITFSASDCVIEANEDIFVVHNLYNSNVSTLGKLVISPKAGIIIGGSVNAVHGIETKSYGSDFGIFSEANVGRDQFSVEKKRRLNSMLEKLLGKQELLAEKRRKILNIYSQISKMPNEKQDIFINLEQRLKQLEAEIDYFKSEASQKSKEENIFNATIKVSDVLYPPLKVQICSAARDIDEKLMNVLLQYDQDSGILVSNPKKT